jgi:DHA1 family tetracycline resistance protein-like MFS transporter
MILFSLCFLLFINSMSIGLVFPIFASMFTQSQTALFSPGTSANMHVFLYSMILAVPTFCMLFGAPFWGRLSDRIGRKNVLLISLSGLALSFAFSALGIWQNSLLVLFGSRALAGFMDGSESIAQAAIADMSTPQNKARQMGFATFSSTIGFIIGPTLGGFLAEPSLTGYYHFEFPFLVSLVLTSINLVALASFFPKAQATRSKERFSYIKLLSKGISFCLDKRIVWFCWLLFVLHLSLAIYFQLSTLILADKFNYSSGQIGLFTTFLGACFSGGIFFVILFLLEKIRYLTLLRGGICFIVLAICMALYFRQSSLLAWASVVPIMLGIAMMYNVLLVLISNSVAEHEQGEAMGSGTALKALGWLVAGLFVGAFYHHVITLWLALLAVVVLALVSTRFISNHQQIVRKQSLVKAEEFSSQHATFLE